MVGPRWHAAGIGWLVLAGGPGLAAQEPEGRQEREAVAIRQAVADYANAFYQTAPDLARRSVRADLAKRGFRWDAASAAFGPAEFMSFERLLAVVDQLRTVEWPPTPRLDVRIYDVLEQTASARLDAEWGTDLIHLARYDGRWMVVSVIWQSHPPPGRGNGLAAFVGEYRLTSEYTIAVTVEDGTLHLQGTGQPKFRLTQLSPTEFDLGVAETRIRFVVAPDGQVTALLVLQAGQEHTATRTR